MVSRRVKVLVSVAIILIIVVVYFIIFSFLTGRITIVRDTDSKKNWSIKFANLEKVILKGTAQEINKPVINNFDTEISVYDVLLHNPNDEIIYRFDVVNSGDYNGIIMNMNIPTPKCTGLGENAINDAKNVCSHLHYTLTYEDGQSVKIGDVLRKKESRKMVLSLRYDDSVIPEEIPKNIVYIGNLNVDVHYSQCGGECKVIEK